MQPRSSKIEQLNIAVHSYWKFATTFYAPDSTNQTLCKLKLAKRNHLYSLVQSKKKNLFSMILENTKILQIRPVKPGLYGNRF
uniref:Uncharacterized protein n=1 Tax=Ciona intestinalis TaxID=7719 RepID=H2Y1R4_CIOIN